MNIKAFKLTCFFTTPPILLSVILAIWVDGNISQSSIWQQFIDVFHLSYSALFAAYVVYHQEHYCELLTLCFKKTVKYVKLDQMIQFFYVLMLAYLLSVFAIGLLPLPSFEGGFDINNDGLFVIFGLLVSFMLLYMEINSLQKLPQNLDQ